MKAGYTVVLAGRRKEKLDEVAAEGAREGGKSLAVPADIADPAIHRGPVCDDEETFGRLDVLFNNAGVGAPAVPLEDLPFDKWKAAVDTNVTGTFLCTQEAFRIMKDQNAAWRPHHQQRLDSQLTRLARSPSPTPRQNTPSPA